MSAAAKTEEKTAAPEPKAETAKAAKRTTGAAPQSFQVSITAAGFNPSTLDIKVGDSVCWTNSDVGKHSVKIVSAPAPKPEKSESGKKLPEHEHDKHHGHEHGTVTKTEDLPPVSGRVSPGTSFEKLFDVAGTFEYVCESNPAMRGTVTVA